MTVNLSTETPDTDVPRIHTEAQAERRLDILAGFHAIAREWHTAGAAHRIRLLVRAGWSR